MCEGAGDRGACLVQAVAHLGEGVARALDIQMQLVVMEPMAQDVVQLTNLALRRLPSLVRAGSHLVDQPAQVSKTLEPSLGFRRLTTQTTTLADASTIADQIALAQPAKQRVDGRHSVDRLAPFVLQGVGEFDEELVGLIRLARGVSVQGHSVTSIRTLTSYRQIAYTRHVTAQLGITSYSVDERVVSMSVFVIVAMLLALSLAGAIVGVDSRPSIGEPPRRNI